MHTDLSLLNIQPKLAQKSQKERKSCHPRRQVSSLHWEALLIRYYLNLLVTQVTAPNGLNAKCCTWPTEVLYACGIVFAEVTNQYPSPVRAYKLGFLHPVSFVDLNFKNYFYSLLTR